MHRFFPLFFALAVFGADWNSKPFPDWSPDIALRVLTDSPWAKGLSVNIEWHKREMKPITYKDVPGSNDRVIKDPALGPLGGIGAPKPKLPTSADLLIRFPNSLPMRHAKALYQLNDEKLPAGKLNSLIDQPRAGYIVEIFGVPSEVAHQGTGTIESLITRSAYLRTRGGRTYRPVRVDVGIQPTTLKILVHFSNEEPLRVSDDEVEFYADLQLFHCKSKFRLKSMVYLGRLEI
ncbi:MAG TPA: hypothetical protein VFQ91_16495 [Bryobacteraceae bacterium]|nr:hypothetical protein [Bryobacteraceae bacterium]